MGQLFPVKSSLSYKGASWEYPLFIFYHCFTAQVRHLPPAAPPPAYYISPLRKYPSSPYCFHDPPSTVPSLDPPKRKSDW